jgi:hypothetical protein
MALIPNADRRSLLLFPEQIVGSPPSMITVDACTPRVVSETALPGLSYILDVTGIVSDGKTLVIDGRSVDPVQKRPIAVLINIETMSVTASMVSFGEYCLPGNRVLFFPRTPDGKSDGRGYSCDVDGENKRLEYVRTTARAKLRSLELFSLDGKLMEVCKETEAIVVCRTSPNDLPESPLEVVVKVPGHFLCRAGNKLFYKNKEQQLCIVNISNPIETAILGSLNTPGLFSPSEDTPENDSPSDETSESTPNVSNYMGRAYPSDDGTKLLFINREGDAVPYESPTALRVFDVPTKQWSRKAILELRDGGTLPVVILPDHCPR